MKPRLSCVLAAGVWVASAFLVAGQSCLVPPAGLVHWWRGEGNSYDTISTEDGVMIGGVQFTPGKVGTAFLFSGSGDDYIELPNDLFPMPTSRTGNSPMSFEVWFQTTISGAILGQQDMAPFDNPLSGYVPALYVGTNGVLYGQIFWGADRQLTSPGVVNEGQFHHVVLTYDGSIESLYLDGARVDSTSFSQEAYSATYYYELGTAFTGGWDGAPGGWFPFTGVIDEASLYNRALAPTEVTLLFNAGQAGKCAPPAAGLVLRHRYSFNGDSASLVITDSVRRAHGGLVFGSLDAPYTNGVPDGSGFTGNGTLELKGTNGCVVMPPRLISVLTNFSLEAWFTWNGPATNVWQRVFDFGINDRGTNANGVGTNYVIFTPARGGTGLPAFEETTVNPFGDLVDPKAAVVAAAAPLNLGEEVYIAITYDPLTNSTRLYLNGALIASTSDPVNASSDFKDHSNWLGRSQWQRDPYFNGTLNEFRIWQGVLSPEEIANHRAAGPDQQFVTTRPALRIARTADSVTLSWPGSGTEAQLQTASSPLASDWTKVTNDIPVEGGVYRVSLPLNTGPTFYQLKQ